MATLGLSIVTLQRGAVEFDIRVDQRVTTEQLGWMFIVQPVTVWLIAENRAFFSSDGAFDLATENITEYTIVTAQGQNMDVYQVRQTPPTRTVTSTPGPSSRGGRLSCSGFNSVLGAQPTRRTPSEHAFLLKNVQARIERMAAADPGFLKRGVARNLTFLSTPTLVKPRRFLIKFRAITAHNCNLKFRRWSIQHSNANVLNADRCIRTQSGVTRSINT